MCMLLSACSEGPCSLECPALCFPCKTRMLKSVFLAKTRMPKSECSAQVCLRLCRFVGLLLYSFAYLYGLGCDLYSLWVGVGL